jgi:hypothetical protein
VLHRMLRPTSFSQVSVWVKTLYRFVLKMPIWGTIGRPCVVLPRGACSTLGGDYALMKQNLIAAAFTVTVLATAACGGGDVAVKPMATKSPTAAASTSPTSSQTPTIDPTARPAVEAYMNFVAARAEALKKPRKLGQNYLPAADFTKFSFDPVRGQANASIVSLGEQGQLFKGDPGRPRVKVAAVEPDAKPYPKVVLKDCPTPTPTWRIYDAKTGKDMTRPLPPGIQPTPYLSTVEVIYYQGRWGVSKIDADTSRTCSI